MRLTIPYYPQNTDYSCGPAALQMVCEYFGYMAPQHALAVQAETNSKDGTATADMIKTATKHGFFCFVNDDSSLHEVFHFLERGLPVIVRFIEPSENGDHYAVVAGLTRHSIILNDPWNGRGSRMSRKRFLARWHSANHDHVAWMMVLSREPFQLGRQYLPQKNA